MSTFFPHIEVVPIFLFIKFFKGEGQQMAEYYNCISSAYFLIHCLEVIKKLEKKNQIAVRLILSWWRFLSYRNSSHNSETNNERSIYYLRKVKTWSLPFYFNSAHAFYSSRYFHALLSVRHLHCFKSVAEPAYCPWKLVQITGLEAASQRCFSNIYSSKFCKIQMKTPVLESLLSQSYR